MYIHEEQLLLENLYQTYPELSSLLSRIEEEYYFLSLNLLDKLFNINTLLYSHVQILEHHIHELPEDCYWIELKQDIKDFSNLLNKISLYNNPYCQTVQSINLESLLKEWIAEYKKAYLKQTISFNFSIVGDSDPFIKNYSCDKEKLRESFYNIIDYMLETEDVIQVTLNADRSKLTTNINGTTYLTIHISNTKTPTSFSKSNSEMQSDITVSLFTAQRIINKHGGTLSIAKFNSVICFLITLPLESNLHFAPDLFGDKLNQLEKREKPFLNNSSN